MAYGVDNQEDKQNGPHQKEGPKDPGKEEENNSDYPEQGTKITPAGGSGILAIGTVNILSKERHKISFLFCLPSYKKELVSFHEKNSVVFTFT